ncbi:bile acid:sodium symporter [Desulfovibrio cuneatus]|uniref:bile acid:sodium symporter n=1 Tax=Desulfovibrio cuneatus TaxID=159728 RepID=UPI00040FF5AF|nr:bile acid:sodium symporter [Desulfovibrio cuneatus]
MMEKARKTEFCNSLIRVTTMRLRDAFLILVAFAGIGAGIFLPQWGKPLEWFPRVSLMIILYLSFLGLKTEALFSSAKTLRPKLTMLVAGKLLLAPLVTFLLLSLILPQFALGGLLLAGAPAGVTSSVFAAIVGADFTLALMGVVLTSLLSPFTLPVLASFALHWLGKNPNAMARFSPLDMSVTMATVILVPFVLAKVMYPRQSRGLEML